MTYGFGPKFWKLGPLPEKADLSEVEAALSTMEKVDPTKPVEIGGTSYTWSPYSFSWRWGFEGDPGHQGYHGLKEIVTEDFLCLGKATWGYNCNYYVKEDAGTQYYLWTCVLADSDTRAKLHSGGLALSQVYVNGRRQSDLNSPVDLKRGSNPLLIRYAQPGRGHFVVEKVGAPEPTTKTPLAMKWYDRPGVLPYDVCPEEDAPAGWYRFIAPPGLRAMTVTCHGVPTGWADGRAIRVQEQGAEASGAKRYRLVLETPIVGQASVALRIQQERGSYAGSTLPEPIRLECGVGRMNLGDWSKDSALECYSGGAWYRKTVTLPPEQVNGRVLLSLGKVVATAEVHVNGQKMGVCVSPPWVIDVSKAVKAGDNTVEILVYNTLANHYVTIPTRYRGPIESGLIGPVTIETRPVVTLTASDIQ